MNDSMLLTNLTSDTAVTAGATVPLGSAIHGYGSSVRLNGDAITIRNPGYYSVNVSVSMAVTGTDEVTLTLVRSGVAIPGASAQATPSAAGEVVNLSFPWVVKKNCCGDDLSISFTVSAAGAINNAIVEVVKL